MAQHLSGLVMNFRPWWRAGSNFLPRNFRHWCRVFSAVLQQGHDPHRIFIQGNLWGIRVGISPLTSSENAVHVLANGDLNAIMK